MNRKYDIIINKTVYRKIQIILVSLLFLLSIIVFFFYPFYVKQILSFILITLIPGFFIDIFLLHYHKNKSISYFTILIWYALSFSYAALFGSSLTILKYLNFINESFITNHIHHTYYIFFILIIIKIIIYYYKNKTYFNVRENIPKLKLPEISTIIIIIVLLISIRLLTGVWSYRFFFISGDIGRYRGAVQEILLGKFPPTGPYRVPNAVEWLYKLILALMVKIGNIDFLEAMNIFTALNLVFTALAIVEIIQIIYPSTSRIISTYLSLFSGGLGWIKFIIDGKTIYDIPISSNISVIDRINVGLGDLIYRNSGNISFYYGRGAVTFIVSLTLTLIFMRIWIMNYMMKNNNNLFTLGALGGAILLIGPQPFIYLYIVLISFLFINILFHFYMKQGCNFLLLNLLYLIKISILAFIISAPWWAVKYYNIYEGVWINLINPSFIDNVIIPIYYFPFRYGIPLFFALISLIIIRKREWRNNLIITFPIIWLLSLIIYNQITVNFISPYSNLSFLLSLNRQSVYLHISIIILASYCISETSKRLNAGKIFIVILLLTSLPSTYLVALGFQTQYFHPFKSIGTYQGIIEFRKMLNHNDVLATDPYLSYQIWEMTGAYLVYLIGNPVNGFDVETYTKYSNSQRLSDLILLLSSNNTNIDIKMDIIKRYNITYLVLSEKMIIKNKFLESYGQSRIESPSELLYELVYVSNVPQFPFSVYRIRNLKDN